jgi:dinuclear metal center YbgI/SA1388 family protein
MENELRLPALPRRLQHVAAWVLPGRPMADVGTDHALLPIHLVQSGHVPRAIASDVRRGPFETALRNVRRFGLEDRISVRLGDGLKAITPGEADTIVVAGLGGDTAAQIIEAASHVARSARRLVLQPMNGEGRLRRVLYEKGCHLVYEGVVEDSGRLYVLLAAEAHAETGERGGIDPAYAPFAGDDVLFSLAFDLGPLLWRQPTPAFLRYVQERLAKWRRVVQAADQSVQPASRTKVERLSAQIERVTEWLQDWGGDGLEVVLGRRSSMKRGMSQCSSGTSPRVADVVRELERWAPLTWALEGDSPGLQVGRWDKPVRTVCLALDAYPKAITAAIDAHADLLVTHHPMLFRSVRQIDTGTARGRALAQALAADLAVYSAHTNLDVAPGGVNDVIAERLGLAQCEPLEVTSRETLYKLVVFVPEEAADAVRDAICAAGAGHIGNYSHCTFRTLGEGTFFPLDGAQPYLGQVGKLERATEYRLETIVPESAREAVVEAMLAAHPYEEVAYDLYRLHLAGPARGIGRVGNLSTPVSLAEFAEQVKQAFHLRGVRYVGDADWRVERVAVLGGSGRRWVRHAIAQGAQVLVTSDMDHHAMAEAWQDGIAVVDATHAALERPVLSAVANRLTAAFGDALTVKVLDIVEDPFVWV